MPSPNLMAASLARRTRDVALIVLGNSVALYNPPMRVAEEFAMLDCFAAAGLSRASRLEAVMDTTSATATTRPRCATTTARPTS